MPARGAPCCRATDTGTPSAPQPEVKSGRAAGSQDPLLIAGQEFLSQPRKSGRLYAWGILSCWCFSVNFLLKQTNPIIKQTTWHCHPTHVSCSDPPLTFLFVHPLLLIPALKLQNNSPCHSFVMELLTWSLSALTWESCSPFSPLPH